jgi:hypothetical protein
VVRKKAAMGNCHTYVLYAEEVGAVAEVVAGGTGTFLLAARRRKKSATSNYLLSLDPGQGLTIDSPRFGLRT